MQSLFPQRAPGGPASAVKPLLSFNAGKCVMMPQAGGKFLITPEKRKGAIALEKDNDGLIHFIWTDRSTGQREDDRIVFPDEIIFKKAKTGRANGNLYIN